MNIPINDKTREAKSEKLIVTQDASSSSQELDINKTSDHLYLERLDFKPELRRTWINFFVVNFRVVILLMIILTGLGVYSFLALPRESNPEVKIPIAVVVTVYPGASPADIEELVTKKLETAISGVKDVSAVTSQSSNSVSSITVEFDARADLESSIRSLRDAVTNAQPELPSEANDPLVREISLDDTPILVMSLSGYSDGFRLREAGERIKDEVEKIPGVREVLISGGDEKEFAVSYDPQKLSFYNLSAEQANQKIRAANLVIPAGTFEGDRLAYPIRADGRFFTAAQLAAIPIFHTDNGAIVYLRDIATVEEKSIKKEVYSRLSSKGQVATDDVTLQIVKKTGGNIIDTVAKVRLVTEEEISKSAPGLRYDAVMDMSEEIEKSFDQLTHDFLLTLILVFGILFLIVGLKEALVAGLAIPLVFFASFGVMLQSGISLNFLSLFSLILALGLLVDDAIVVVSATKQYLRSGKFTPEEAVLLVLNDFKVVLLTTTLTTVWAFLPLLMASGIIGEFIKSLPITVSVTLISSLVIALVINHPLAAVLERIRLTHRMFMVSWFLSLIIALACGFFGGLVGAVAAVLLLMVATWALVWYRRGGQFSLYKNADLSEREWVSDELIKKKLREQGSHENDNFGQRLLHGIVRFDMVLPIYEKHLRRLLATKKTRLATLAVTLLVFIAAIALPATGIIQSEFFPPSDSTQLNISLEAPTGLKLDETDKIARQVEEKLYQYPEIEAFTTIVGRGGSDSFAAGSSMSNLASFTLKLSPEDDRDIKAYELADKMNEDFRNIQAATVKAAAPSSGPPSGAAFEAQISGDDLQTLASIASELEDTLRQLPDVVQTDISLKDSPADYTFTLDSARLELYNLTAAQVGSALRLAITGTEVTTVISGGDETSVRASFAADKIPDLEAVQNLQIINSKQQPVFLKDVARVELKPSVSSILRVDQRRTVLLSANLKGGANAALTVAAFQDKIKDYAWPSGYSISYGGENEQNAESVMSVLRAMVVAFFLIISTLIIQFNSFKQAFMVLVTVPLALIGVFFGLAVTGLNLSFPGLIGILALCGIVVKNAIILMDKINLNLKSGIPFVEAIVDAGKSRLEAIFITSICTILGIIPITMSNEIWRSLGGAIIFGLMLSSFMTLFILPVLFMSLTKPKKYG